MLSPPQLSRRVVLAGLGGVGGLALLGAPARAASLYVPASLAPGARVQYESGSSFQADFQKPASAGVGITRYEILANTGSRVLMRAGTFLSDSGGYSYGGSSYASVDAAAVSTGSQLWIDPAVLGGLRTSGQTTVADGEWPMGGRTWAVRSVTRVAGDEATRQVWDRESGLLVAQQIATGAQRPGFTDPFMRQNGSSMAWSSQRQVRLPWADSGTPAWARGVRRLVYEGQQGLAGGYGPTVSSPMRHTIDVAEQGEGWAHGSVTVDLQGQPQARNPTGYGTGGMGLWWIDPAVLAAMRPGVLDRDPQLGTTLQYELGQGPSGPLGVVRESGSRHQLAWGYSLQDGALLHSTYQQQAMGIFAELHLVARQ